MDWFLCYRDLVLKELNFTVTVGLHGLHSSKYFKGDKTFQCKSIFTKRNPITAMAEGRSKGNLSEPCQISKMERFEKVFNG